jgi:hypothetical protein
MTLALPTVTLCSVDTRTPALAVRALQRCMQDIRFAHAVLFTEGTLALPDGIEGIDIGAIRSSADYSQFMLRRLLDHITTDHVLVVQWDGFVAHSACWDAAFLQADYLGAPWGKAPAGQFVGNGGFSLRSRRLLQALRDPALAARLHHPEDICIGQTLRANLESQHSIVFGTLEQARRFAFENESPPGPTFGFHGVFNLERALGPEEFAGWVDELPAAVVAGRDGFKLARNLVDDGRDALAQRLLQRRRALGAEDWRSRWLAWRCRRPGRGFI